MVVAFRGDDTTLIVGSQSPRWRLNGNGEFVLYVDATAPATVGGRYNGGLSAGL